MSLVRYLTYLPARGEIVAVGVCQAGRIPSVPDIAGTLYLDIGEPTATSVSSATHYVSGGALQTYTAPQRAAKAEPPAHPALWHNGSFAWIDVRSLAQAKASKWDEIKAAREAAVEAPVLATPFGAIDADAAGIENIKSTVAGLREAQALGVAPASIDWTMADNSTVALTQAQLAQISVLLLQRGNEAHQRARVRRTQIAAATTAAQVAAITWE